MVVEGWLSLRSLPPKLAMDALVVTDMLDGCEKEEEESGMRRLNTADEGEGKPGFDFLFGGGLPHGTPSQP